MGRGLIMSHYKNNYIYIYIYMWAGTSSCPIIYMDEVAEQEDAVAELWRTQSHESQSYGVAELSHESTLVFSPLRAASKPRRLRPATPGFECALYRFVTRYFLVLARGESRPEAF